MQIGHLGRRWGRWLLVLLVVGAVGAGGRYLAVRGKASAGTSLPREAETRAGLPVSVEVTSPLAGGLNRLCLQPGTVEPFEAADLYAKVSGFLVEQKVDIGYLVRAGDVLARIAVPEHETQVKHDTADVVRAEARVDQMKASITTAEADLATATAAIGLAQAEKQSKAAFREYHEKQRDRLVHVAAKGVIDGQVSDEMRKECEAAVAADLAASHGIAVARQKEAAARARIQQARADLRYAEAEVETARAQLEKSRVLLDYTIIRSPYDGVVTKRNYFRGDFVRSADAGGERIPVLAVERTDVMRIVIQVPERDVPFVDCGDPAVVEVDALPGVVFKTHGADKVVVSRLAASEDPYTRMMRTEVHVKNPEGKLRRGMFGRVMLTLQTGAPGSLRIPSSALAGKASAGKGSVRVVRNEKVSFVPVTYGADNGSEVEILSGLAAQDRVILRAAGPVQDGSAVAMVEAKVSPPTH